MGKVRKTFERVSVLLLRAEWSVYQAQKVMRVRVVVWVSVCVRVCVRVGEMCGRMRIEGWGEVVAGKVVKWWS